MTRHLASLTLVGIMACGLGACGGEAETSDEAVDEIEEGAMTCAVQPTTAAHAKARIRGYVIGDGVSTANHTYRLALGSTSLANHFAALVQTAGLDNVERSGSTFEIPIAELGEYFVPSAADHSYPFDPPAYLANAPALPAYDAQTPGCTIRETLAAVMEVDGAQDKPAAAKQQVIDDPHAKKQAAFVAAWKAIGASSAHIQGDGVLIAPKDNPIAQCLPNRTFGRVPGGKPAPGTCQ